MTNTNVATPASAKMKVCSKCGEVKGLDEFHRDNSRKDGRRDGCKQCHNAYQANQSKKNKARNLAAGPQDESGLKWCPDCKQTRPRSEFNKSMSMNDGKQDRCKYCSRSLDAAYRKKNRARIENDPEWYEKLPPDKKCSKCKERKPVAEFMRDKRTHDGLSPRCNGCVAAYLKRRRKSDPYYRAQHSLLARLWWLLKKNPSPNDDRVLSLEGCSLAFLRQHLESQFQPGMTWENRGEYWNPDHIVPTSRLLKKYGERAKEIANHWRNLQPLTQPDNLDKSDKIFHPLCNPDPIFVGMMVDLQDSLNAERRASEES